MTFLPVWVNNKHSTHKSEKLVTLFLKELTLTLVVENAKLACFVFKIIEILDVLLTAKKS